MAWTFVNGETDRCPFCGSELVADGGPRMNQAFFRCVRFGSGCTFQIEATALAVEPVCPGCAGKLKCNATVMDVFRFWCENPACRKCEPKMKDVMCKHARPWVQEMRGLGGDVDRLRRCGCLVKEQGPRERGYVDDMLLKMGLKKGSVENTECPLAHGANWTACPFYEAP